MVACIVKEQAVQGGSFVLESCLAFVAAGLPTGTESVRNEQSNEEPKCVMRTDVRTSLLAVQQLGWPRHRRI